MSKVFYEGCPLFVHDKDLPTMEIVQLHHSELDKISENVLKMFSSPISLSGARKFKHRGKHTTFKVTENLFKYDSESRPSPHSSSKEVAKMLLKHEGHDVEFYPFYDINNPKPVRDKSGTPVLCHLVSVDFSFKERAGSKYDIAIMTFMTNNFHDMSKLMRD